MLKRIASLVFPLAALTGCTIQVAPTPAPRGDAISIVRESANEMPQIIQWNNFGGENIGSREWLAVAGSRFNNPIVFSCHGGVHAAGGRKEWWVYPDAPRQPMPVEKVAETLANLYPDRDIILNVCNPGGFDLHVKRVWYSRKAQWLTPDAFAYGAWHHETMRDWDTVGSIWEFVTYDGRPDAPQPAPVVAPTTATATAPTTKPTTAPTTRPCTNPSSCPAK